jgi:hypothetical protein
MNEKIIIFFENKKVGSISLEDDYIMVNNKPCFSLNNLKIINKIDSFDKLKFTFLNESFMFYKIKYNLKGIGPKRILSIIDELKGRVFLRKIIKNENINIFEKYLPFTIQGEMIFGFKKDKLEFKKFVEINFLDCLFNIFPIIWNSTSQNEDYFLKWSSLEKEIEEEKENMKEEESNWKLMKRY